MPRLHKYRNRNACYVLTAIRGAVITYQLTADGEKKLTAAGSYLRRSTLATVSGSLLTSYSYAHLPARCPQAPAADDQDTKSRRSPPPPGPKRNIPRPFSKPRHKRRSRSATSSLTFGVAPSSDAAGTAYSSSPFEDAPDVRVIIRPGSCGISSFNFPPARQFS